jgi:flagellar export protein FliJ
MKWAGSLIRIANHEVETLQKRLAEIAGRRQNAEMRMTMLVAEAEGEQARAKLDPEGSWRLSAYLEGWRLRRDAAKLQIAGLLAEEAGARDALSKAFEELKKFEHVAEVARLNELKEEGRRETAALDEMGLRQATGR